MSEHWIFAGIAIFCLFALICLASAVFYARRGGKPDMASDYWRDA